MVETVGPPLFNCKNLYSGISRRCRQAGAVVETFLGGATLPTTADVIFCQLEVIESVVFLVFERVVFLNVEKKKSIWSVSVTKKWEKWADY